MSTFLLYISNILISILPPTRCFSLKRLLLRMSGVVLGENVRICSSAKFYGSGIIEIGDNVWIGHGVQIISSSKVSIGNNVDIAPGVLITTGTHEIDKTGSHIAGNGISKDVEIENGAWICARAIILPGVHIGEKSVVAAGSLVNRDVDRYVVCGGVPAKIIKHL